jgi:hypothetical protein
MVSSGLMDCVLGLQIPDVSPETVTSEDAGESSGIVT